MNATCPFIKTMSDHRINGVLEYQQGLLNWYFELRDILQLRDHSSTCTHY